MIFRFLLLLLLTSSSTFAQRTIPNPIILVHGWTGSNSTWNEFTNYLQIQASLTIERNALTYNLNCDNTIYSSYLYNDVCDRNNGSIGNKDVYIMNFDYGHQSNQSAAVKQGYALKLAISKVLNATGASNVTLLGHSMGGLAIREYLQNSSNWQNDGQHHVAKVATIGTPHYGSDISGNGLLIFIGKDENSEAIRDLRESFIYSSCVRNGQKIPCPGVYLWGGQETKTWMITNIYGGSNYYNLDVNCNGYIGDNIVGLNQKSISSNLDYACVIGGPNYNDGIVTTYSQNINNIYPSLGAELFYYNCGFDLINCHSNEPKKAFIEMIQAIDEPKKYPTSIKFGATNKGFFTKQTNGSNTDKDEYVIYTNQRGVLTYYVGSLAASNAIINITDPSGNLIVSENIGSSISKTVNISTAGNYKVAIQGSSLGNWATYNFLLDFCGMPVLPTITTFSSTSFCEGQSIILSTIGGYNDYKWFKDGIQLPNNTNQLSVNQTGLFTVQASRCGITSNSTNIISTNVKPNPTKPIITKEDQLDQFLLTSSSIENNQWFLNGNLINSATTQTLVPQELGIYKVQVTKDGCTSLSDESKVQMDKPEIALIGSNPLCEGDSIKLVAPTGFGGFIFTDGEKEIKTAKNELFVKKSGNYSVKTQRGKFISSSADAQAVKVNPKPEKPIMTLESFGFKSSSSSNNQWFLNGTTIKDSTGQYLVISGWGNYMVRVTENECFSDSDAFIITGIEPNSNIIPIKLYPNPNQGIFWIELPEAYKTWQVDIFDIQGKLIFNKLHNDSISRKEKIEIKPNSGSYILRVTTDQGIQSIRLVVE